MQTPRSWIWQHADWPHFRWDEAGLSPLLAQARLAQGKALGAARLLDSSLSLEAVASILVEDGLTTSAIEGEQLDVDAVRSSVARRLGLPTAGLPAPPRAVDGLIDVLLDATQHHDQALTSKRLCAWQAALFPTGRSGLHAIRVGELRGDEPMQVVSGGVGKEHVHFIAPPRDGLEAQLKDFLDWFARAPAGMDGLVRALTDMALSQDERQPMRLFSLSAQILRERESYYAILERTQRGGLDITEWLAWFLVQVAAAASAAENTVANTLAKARFWLRHQSTPLNARQRKALNRLLDAGPDGFEGGINTRKYMSLTKTSRTTAYRELAEMVEKGCLTPTGKGGRSSGYVVAWQVA